MGLTNPQKGIWSYTSLDMINPQKGIWSYISPNMTNPQKGIDLYNNKTIIFRISFVVTIFQLSPLITRVFYNTTSSREREGNNIIGIWNID